MINLRLVRKASLTLFILLLSCSILHAQLPPKHWANHYGGIGVDIPYSIKVTTDGGTVLAGYTDSRSGDVSPHTNRDYWDLWIVKLDKCGLIQWEKSFGGTGYESARDILQTEDGGYLVLGETNSVDGDVIQGYGSTKDIWLLRLDASGTLLWQKRLGGSGLDIGNKLCPSGDGGFFVAASSTSNDGDIRGNHSTGTYTDGVLLRITENGSLIWSKCFGGTKNEELFSIEIIGNTLYASGFTNSIDGDIPPNQLNYDVWLLSVDLNGNKKYSKIFGGSQNDVAYAMCRGADNSLTLAGYTTSNDGHVSGAKGSQDYWVINVSQKGDLNWQRVLGGSDADYARTVITDQDSGYIVGGVSYSNDKDLTGARGDGDFWTVKLTSSGEIGWRLNWGGSSNDHMRSMVRNSATGEYYLAGDSESSDGDFNNALGDADFAIIKFKELKITIADSVVCSVDGFIPFKDTLTDACGYDSAIVDYQPVPLGGPFDNGRKRDTIFIGHSVTLKPTANGTVTWDPHPTLSCTQCAEPVASPFITTTYIATNATADDCEVKGEFTVVVLNDALIKMPTGFTPNADGRNDFYGALGKVPDGYKLQIYNRDGEIVFNSNEIYSKWNGHFKGAVQPPGVFIYFVTYKDLKNVIHQQKGTLMLIR